MNSLTPWINSHSKAHFPSPLHDPTQPNRPISPTQASQAWWQGLSSCAANAQPPMVGTDAQKERVAPSHWFSPAPACTHIPPGGRRQAPHRPRAAIGAEKIQNPKPRRAPSSLPPTRKAFAGESCLPRRVLLASLWPAMLIVLCLAQDGGRASPEKSVAVVVIVAACRRS